MKVIGLTGGVGSGKSRVLSYLEERHKAFVCQADHVAWELQYPGTECYKKIVEHFGRNVLEEDGTLNRKQLGAIVFSDTDELMQLNDIMHPAVKEQIKDVLAKERQAGTGLFVLEAALLIEEGYGKICDELWYIYADEQTRILRLKESRGYSDEKIRDMMASQLSKEAYEEGCDRIIDNSGSFEDTARQIDKALKE